MHTALLVIDFINDISDPKGKIARSAERIEKNRVIDRANEAIAMARKKGWLLLFFKVGFHPGYPECPPNSPLFGAAPKHGALLLGSWGTDFHEDLDVQKTDLVLVKHRVNCFYATPLEAILRAKNIQTIVLAGTATNMAIEHTARDAHDRDYTVVVLKDCCETASEEAQIASLESLSRIAQIKTLTDF
jgi:nicotinamidase-related amidase